MVVNHRGDLEWSSFMHTLCRTMVVLIILVEHMYYDLYSLLFATILYYICTDYVL